MAELTAPVAMCSARGLLNREAVGWSRRPLHGCALPSRWGRRKRWDYWCVITDTHALAVTVADLDWLGLAVVTFFDFSASTPLERVAVWPLGLRERLPDGPHERPIALSQRGLELSIAPVAQGTELRASFGALRAEVAIDRPASHESLNVLVPWDERRFQLTSKQLALPARGSVTVGGRAWPFEAGRSFATLDFGRGVWPHATRWNWGCAAGPGVGLNLGARWTDGTGQTENGVVAGGRLHKLEEPVDFDYRLDDAHGPWRIRSRGSPRVDLTFLPQTSRDVRLNLGVLAGALHLRVGRWSGRVLLDDGAPLELDGLLGWAEEVRLRW